MMLAGIKSGAAHSDLRTFECSKCKNVHTLLVEDPMKSAQTRWQDSACEQP
jgi:hypothetical protein